MQDLLADLVETSGKNPKGGLQQIKRKICRDGEAGGGLCGGGGGWVSHPNFLEVKCFVQVEALEVPVILHLINVSFFQRNNSLRMLKIPFPSL